MGGAIHLASLAGLAALLIVAAVGDWRRFTIPNWLTGSVALLAIPFWLSAGAPVLPTLFWQVGLAAAVFLLFAGLFAVGAMGGGDVKLLAALALWIAPIDFVRMMLVVAIIGGLLTGFLLARHRLRRAAGNPKIPYGVAISLAALIAIGEPIVNQFSG